MVADDSNMTNGVSSTRPTEKQAFEATPPTKHIERMHRAGEAKGEVGIALSELWLGLAAQKDHDGRVNIAFACHDGTYTIDFAVHQLSVKEQDVRDKQDSECPTSLPTDSAGQATAVAEYVVCKIRNYCSQNSYKFLGAGISQEIIKLSPRAPARLWAELDIVPIVIRDEEGGSMERAKEVDAVLGVDELADSMARKCLQYFGPSGQPRVQVGFSNKVEVDLDGRAQLTALEQYKYAVNEHTWSAALKYAQSLKQGKKKFAFFSATPQGGGVALMRHALVRFFRLLGVDCTWWVPKPKPEVFRVTKTNHNILQGVADPKERLTKDHQKLIDDWIKNNAERFWTRKGGPLAPRSEGGVDVVIVDDPQMPGIVDIAKAQDPDRPVIFRSHIQVRSDLVAKPETPTAGVWEWLWVSAQHADLFISHPVSAFVPHTVEKNRLGYMPATTDWHDGLNKELSEFDTRYYLHEFNTECQRQRMTTLAFPKRDYIVQIARFDPAKGIPDVLASYAEFRRNSDFCKNKNKDETPQLVVCGHYSVDDPDGVMVLNQTLELLDTKYSDIKDSVVVMRLGPTDQLLNALMSNAKVALQLSTREGFEVKVSEGLHKGVPMIVTQAGGIPLQVQHDKSGFLVETGDSSAVAKYLDVLFSDKQKYETMSQFAASHVSDEVGTVGNAVCWMYLADKLSKRGEKLEPNGRWIWDLARDEAGESKGSKEVWLPRDWTT
ncbi:Uu.00g032890.m01.CDS01 [Anthostomella pinea]|uniref:Uu.00g032890.m01.CDS01 n=1 Tax=Anthostomella pinea TaxID=933095 RepID=A0AAI8V8S0_9PEZI|nr:Uu.00g032890.m01.CDS01 [Anthostomella pinea]